MRPGRRQKGQAIVLVALILVVLFGFLGLAVDSGRIYIDRRELQTAADSAALAAADAFWNAHSAGQSDAAADSAATAAGARVFALNEHLDPTSFAASGNGAYSMSGYALTLSRLTPAAPNAANVYEARASEQVPVTIMAALGTASSVQIVAAARATVGAQFSSPVLMTLSTGDCSGNNAGSSLTIQGNSTAILTGSVYDNGSVFANSASSTAAVTESIFENCTPLSGLAQIQYGAAYPNSPPMPDPLFGYDQLQQVLYGPYASLAPSSPGTEVEIGPGPYAVDPRLNGTNCYFLEPGIYNWQGGFTSNGAFASNELTAPDDPFWDNNGAGCAGSVRASAVPGTSLPHLTTWGVEVTAVRTDAGYVRESMPSGIPSGLPSTGVPPQTCVTVSVGANQGIQVAVSNSPGARGYRFYLSPTGCSGPFGFAGEYVFPATFIEHTDNQTIKSCPYTPALPAAPGAGTSACSLGYTVSPVFDGTLISGSWTVIGTQCSSSSPVSGCRPPAGGITGDRANQHYIVGTGSSALTPGAVQFYFSGNSCLDQQGGGAVYAFSGVQFGYVVLYAPGTCSNNSGVPQNSKLTGGSYTQYIGVTYFPRSGLSISGGNISPVAGAIIVYSAVITGGGNLAVSGLSNQWLVPSVGRLIRCTAPDLTGTSCPAI